MSHSVIFAAAYNTGGKKDATGAFKPGAKKLARYLGSLVHVVHVDNRIPFGARGDAVLAELEMLVKEVGPVRNAAFFCHGWSTGLQLGFRSPRGAKNRGDLRRWKKLLDLLGQDDEATVGLYACSTGDGPDGEETPDAPGAGDDSFGDLMRDGLCARGAVYCRVVSHTTAGHAYHNPDVVIFDGLSNPYGGRGGAVIVPPTASRARAAFRRLLRKDDGVDAVAWRLLHETISAIADAIAREAR